MSNSLFQVEEALTYMCMNPDLSCKQHYKAWQQRTYNPSCTVLGSQEDLALDRQA